MLKAGRIQTLTVSRVSEYGLYLADEEQNEVLLPNRYTSLTDKVGDRKEVFLYHDSEDRLVATTETPLLREGEAGYLRVVDKTAHGAFLDWGLHGKDLFLPNRNQQGGILAGHSYIVYLYEDNITGRCVATTKLKSFINNDLITVKPREEVSLLVASESEIGFRVIVNNRHWGMIYRNQIFRPVAVGDRLKGYVRRITEDNRIDVSLQQTGFAQVKDSAEVLLRASRERAKRFSNARWACSSSAARSKPAKKASKSGNMAKINTAERVSAEASDNFVFQRSLLAYHAASARIAGDVLEIGTGAGYGIEVAAPRARRWTSPTEVSTA